MEELIAIPIVAILFIGLPWLIFHYVTRWKTAGTLTGADEKLLDELHDAARRLDDRLCTIERIMTAENQTGATVPARAAPRTPHVERGVRAMSTQPPSRTRFTATPPRQGDGRLRRHRRLYRDGRQSGPGHDVTAIVLGSGSPI